MTDDVNFLFDTGGGLPLISPELAAVVGCEPFGRLTGYRATGEEVQVQPCGPLSMYAESLVPTPEVGVFDLMALLPDGLPPL